MTTTPTPSRDPADTAGMPGMLQAVFKKLMQATDGMMPAKVVSYDRANNRAVIQPLIAVLGTDGSVTPRAVLADISVLQMGGGNYVLNFPLVKDDLGWIEASDRDISLFLQSYQQAQPNTARLHRFSDGRFVPDAFKRYLINAEDATAVVLQTLDGSTRIALDSAGSQVRMRATTVDVQCENYSVTASTKVTYVTPLVDYGNATLTGMGDLEFDSVKFSTHTHIYTPGTGTPTEVGAPKNP